MKEEIFWGMIWTGCGLIIAIVAIIFFPIIGIFYYGAKLIDKIL